MVVLEEKSGDHHLGAINVYANCIHAGMEVILLGKVRTLICCWCKSEDPQSQWGSSPEGHEYPPKLWV